MASITKKLKPQQRLWDLGWFHSSSLQTKRSFFFEKMSEHYCEKIKIFRKNLHYKRCRIQVVFRVALLWNKCYFWLCYFQLAVFLCLFNFCFLYLGVLWIFNWNVNSSKLFTDDDQFYNFIHFYFFTSIFRLYQNTGPKTVQTNNNWYLQKCKKFQIISKVYFVRKLNVKTIKYAAILIFFSRKIQLLEKNVIRIYFLSDW